MFQAGDRVAFKSNPQHVFEVASYSQAFGYDIWNEDSYYLAIHESQLCLVERCPWLNACCV